MNPTPAKETLFLHSATMGLGAWQWGDKFVWNYGRGYNDQDIEAAFLASLQAGINLVDTAEIYGAGKSESLLGSMLHRTEQSVLIATKFLPYPWRLGKNSVIKALQGSLQRLGVKKVDLYQIHWPSPLTPIETFTEGLALVVHAGLTRTVGVSNFNKHQMQRAYTVLSRHDIPLASNQVEYHLLNRKIETSGLLERCHELGIRVIAYSPLAKGLLTGKYTPTNPPPASRGNTSRDFLLRLQGLIALMTEIGQGHDAKTPSQVALNWTIAKGTLPIPGAKNQTQAIQNAASTGWKLSADEVKALDTASDALANV